MGGTTFKTVYGLPDIGPGSFIGSDRSAYGDAAIFGNFRCYKSDAFNIDVPVFLGKAELAGKVQPHDVSVQKRDRPPPDLASSAVRIQAAADHVRSWGTTEDGGDRALLQAADPDVRRNAAGFLASLGAQGDEHVAAAVVDRLT